MAFPIIPMVLGAVGGFIFGELFQESEKPDKKVVDIAKNMPNNEINKNDTKIVSENFSERIIEKEVIETPEKGEVDEHKKHADDSSDIGSGSVGE